VEPGKYERGVRWLRELLYENKFTAERLITVAAKLVIEVAECRRQARSISDLISKDLNFKPGKNRIEYMEKDHMGMSMLHTDLQETWVHLKVYLSVTLWKTK